MGEETRNRPYRHYALIYIDEDGNLCQDSSPSIAQNRENIISPRVRNAFLGAVASSRDSISARPHGDVDSPTRRSTLSTRAPSQLAQRLVRRPSQPMPSISDRNLIAQQFSQESPLSSPTWPTPHENGAEAVLVRSHNMRPKSYTAENLQVNDNEKVKVFVRDKAFLRKYYETAFKKLQQINCRILAKVYVKLVEPRKQVNYPYNGRRPFNGRTQQLDPSETKPPWWPSGVSHREPDHLPKAERIRLLIHLLCDLHATHSVTAQKLKEADQPIRRQITPQERLSILDELYDVRQEEENFLNGRIDGKAMVSISRANLPDPLNATGLSNHRMEEASANQSRNPEVTSIPSNSQHGICGQSGLDFSAGHLEPHMASFPPSTSFARNQSTAHLNTGYTPTAPTPEELRRKRQINQTGVAISESPTPVGFNDLTFGGPQTYAQDPLSQTEGFYPPMLATTVPPSIDGYSGEMDHPLGYFFNSQG